MIFPFIDGGTESSIEEKQTPKEYAWDFENDTLALINGKPFIVEGLDAVRVWVYMALKTQRYKHLAYTWNYGTEINELIGKKMPTSKLNQEAKQLIEDALLINPYIKAISNVSTKQVKNKIEINATIQTTFGEVDVNV